MSMSDKQAVIEEIRAAFQGLAFPGEHLLQGSVEGEEPFDEVVPFRGHRDWAAVEPGLLDAHSAALESFWRERARSAPTADALQQHLAAEKAYLEAIQSRTTGSPP